jgi:hypothetical protein
MVKFFAVASVVIAVLCFAAASGFMIGTSHFVTSRSSGKTSGTANVHAPSYIERGFYAVIGLGLLAAGAFLLRHDTRGGE